MDVFLEILKLKIKEYITVKYSFSEQFITLTISFHIKLNI